MQPKRISRQMLKRLPLYLEYLKSLPEDVCNISATAIARALDLGEVQVRKDLARVSGGGKRKTGHNRHRLIADIVVFLDFARPTGAIVVGAGKLGQALLDYGNFDKSGLDIMAGFDILPDVKVSQKGKPIYPMDMLGAFCEENEIQIGILAVPSENAQQVCDQLVACGIRAIWNFVPVNLSVPRDVLLYSENLAASAATLRLQMKSMSQSGPEKLPEFED